MTLPSIKKIQTSSAVQDKKQIQGAPRDYNFLALRRKESEQSGNYSHAVKYRTAHSYQIGTQLLPLSVFLTTYTACIRGKSIKTPQIDLLRFPA